MTDIQHADCMSSQILLLLLLTGNQPDVTSLCSNSADLVNPKVKKMYFVLNYLPCSIDCVVLKTQNYLIF